MKKFLIAAAAALFLSGCAYLVAETPAQKVYAIQADYNGPLAAAVAYESQPRCVGLQTSIEGCSEVKVVEALRKADDDVNAALRAAQNVVRTPGVSDSKVNLALVSFKQVIAAFEVILADHGISFATGE